MATFTKRVLSQNDNGYWAGSWLANGSLGSSFGIGKNFLGGTVYAGVRFNNVTVPQGVTIDSAFLKITAQESKSDNILFTLYGIDEDDTADLTSDPNGRAKTSASINWQINGQTIDTEYTSPDIKALIQEIVDRGGWAAGNDLALITSDNGTSNDKIGRFYSYDGSNSKAAYLEINYTGGTTTSTTTTSTTTTSTSTTTTSTSTTTLPPEPVFHGLKVFKPGAPSTLEPKNFYLNSRYKMLKIHKQGSFSSIYIRSVGLSLTIPYVGLNYRPIVLVYMQRMNHDGVMDTDYHLLEWSYFGATKAGFQSVKAYSDRMVIDYIDNLVDDLAINFSVLGYYYVFREEVRE